MEPQPDQQYNQASLAFLQQQKIHFSRGLYKVLMLAVAKFISQVLGLYLFSDIVAQMVVVGLKPTAGYYAALGVAFGFYLVLLRLFQKQKLKVAQAVLTHFQRALLGNLRQHGLATIRDHSLASWQSFFIKRLPALQAYYSEYLPQKIIAMVIPVIVLVVVFPFSWLVALVLLLAAPLIPLFMWLVGQGAAAAHQRHFRALERLGSIFQDRLNARQLLHAHNAVSQQKRFFVEASSTLKDRTLQVLRLAFVSSSVLDFFATLGMALVAVFVGFSLLGDITFGSWAAGLRLQEGLFLLLLSPLFFSELKLLGRFYHLRAEALGAADALREILVEERLVAPVTLPLNLQHFRVANKHGQEQVTAKKIQLHKGDKILIQGSSGAGKTTLLEGLVGLRPVAAEPLAVLPKEHVAWLTQDPVMFPCSLRDNLSLGHKIDEQKLIDMLRKVELFDWLQGLENGLDTLMGDYPALSGGQRQRLAIARILLFDKPIVFLDEPTAHLGRLQAQRITQLLQETFADKTLLWVAHDLPMSSFFCGYWWVTKEGEVRTQAGEQLCA